MDAITLDQLRVLQAIVEHGSFSAAARSLHRAQSAVSYAIANLEAQLELELFDRSGRIPTLTEAGEALLVEARRVSAQVDRLRARARSIQQGVEPTLSLAVDMLFPMPRLIATLRRFREVFPQVTLRIYTEALGAVYQLVNDGACHLGIALGSMREHGALTARPLLEIELVPVVAAGHPLATLRQPVRVEALRQHVQLVITDRSAVTQGVDRGVISDDTWRLADLGTKHAFLLAGLGWGNMPRHLIADDLDAGRLVTLRREGQEGALSVPLEAVHLLARPPGPAGQWLLEHLAQRP